MITVKLFGLLRLQSGIKELHTEADSIKALYPVLCAQTDRISQKDLEQCVIFINGEKGTKKSKLQHGDTVILMSPVAGG